MIIGRRLILLMLGLLLALPHAAAALVPAAERGVATTDHPSAYDYDGALNNASARPVV